jgi:hypothetical protein
MTIDGGNRTVELYVRSLAPRAAHDRLEDFVETLETLEARDRIGDYSVHVWGSRIDRTSAAARTEAGRFVTGRVEAFTDWACEQGLSLGTFFEEESVESSITGEEYTALTLPTAALAEYVDEELALVAPCSDGDSVCTVMDRLEALEGNGPATTAPQPKTTGTN